jgi:LmbE family N-acetylglucosaminyl deacetylase
MHGARILILAPHPDDEVVGCAAAIGRARRQGARLAVFHLTTGVAAREVQWPWRRSRHPDIVARRREEATAAARLLEVEIAGFQDVATRNLRFHISETRAAIRDLVTRSNIDVIWVPAYEGGHQDHDTANFIASTIGGDAAVWEFAEYNFAGGRIRSQEFIAPTGQEIELALTSDEVSWKRAALALYRSERGNLGYVGTERECFRPLAPYEYRRPPHPGPAFYQRFQWVPFRHPRIDFARPEEVSATLSGDRLAPN